MKLDAFLIILSTVVAGLIALTSLELLNYLFGTYAFLEWGWILIIGFSYLITVWFFKLFQGKGIRYKLMLVGALLAVLAGISIIYRNIVL